MKTKIPTLAFFALLFTNLFFAQDVTTVKAKNDDISDNLDLRAVASIFGDAANLDDFEKRLNNPKEQISNLDLNKDGNVDYLRVIESVEGRMHLIIIQAVLEKDVFQDVATIDVDRDNNNNVQVQVVGDVYMYGQNYIYEPVYVSRPIIYDTFWIESYRPYYSPWYFGYYPVYFSYWNPYPIFSYRRNVNVYINVYNNYNYVNYRTNQRAVAFYSDRRSNGYEKMNPNRSFNQRNNNVYNRYELDKTRNLGTRDNSIKNNPNPGNVNNPRNNPGLKNENVIRNNSPRESVNPKSEFQPIRKNENVIRNNAPSESVNPKSEFQPIRKNENVIRNNTPSESVNPKSEFQPVRNNENVIRNNTPRESVNPKSEFPPVRKNENVIRNNSPRESVNPKSEFQPVRNNENVIRNNSPRANVSSESEVQPRTASARDVTSRPRENASPRIENRTYSSNPTPRSGNENGNRRN
ncbi:MAG: hypothetical protein H7250_07750 [Flavobacterium sp.]|nr:hypothetical protein [Flavobacterium sp.]